MWSITFEFWNASSLIRWRVDRSTRSCARTGTIASTARTHGIAESLLRFISILYGRFPLRECYATLPFAPGLRFGHRRPRQHLRPHRSVIGKGRFDGGCLHQVALLDAVINVHIRVVSSRSVIQ